MVKSIFLKTHFTVIIAKFTAKISRINFDSVHLFLFVRIQHVLKTLFTLENTSKFS